MKRYMAMLAGAISATAGVIFSACIACGPACTSGGCCGAPALSVTGPLVGVLGAGVSVFLHAYSPVFVVLGAGVLAAGAYMTVRDRASKKEAVRRQNAMSESKGCCCSCSCGGAVSGDDIKAAVRETYGKAAVNASERKAASCCGSGTSKDAITRDLYTEAETEGIPVEALLASLGCANPMALANLNPGEVVLDLGSGGGIDVLLSAKRVGPTGKAYGLDMTDEMLDLARKNQAEAGVENVEFLKGEIESIPLPDASVDVIISNCVINLSTDKDQVLREAFRVLKSGGRFAVADIVLTRPVSDTVKEHVGLWTGCVAGALEINEYKLKLLQAGFTDADVEIVKTYSEADSDGLVPDEVAQQLGKEGIAELMTSFVSAFVRAMKPKGCCCRG